MAVVINGYTKEEIAFKLRLSQLTDNPFSSQRELTSIEQIDEAIAYIKDEIADNHETIKSLKLQGSLEKTNSYRGEINYLKLKSSTLKYQKSLLKKLRMFYN